MNKENLSYALYTLLCIVFLSSCESENEYDGLILTDPKTGRVFLLKHHVGDIYFIDERVIKITGKDTTEVFE